MSLAYLGFFCLGGFIGGFLSLGLGMMTTLTDFRKVLATVVAAAFTGGVFFFIQYLRDGGPDDAAFAYPVGLVVAAMWSYAPVAAANIRKKGSWNKLIGLGHIVGLVVVSVLALALFVPPAFGKTWGWVHRAPASSSGSEVKPPGGK